MTWFLTESLRTSELMSPLVLEYVSNVELICMMQYLGSVNVLKQNSDVLAMEYIFCKKYQLDLTIYNLKICFNILSDVFVKIFSVAADYLNCYKTADFVNIPGSSRTVTQRTLSKQLHFRVYKIEES